MFGLICGAIGVGGGMLAMWAGSVAAGAREPPTASLAGTPIFPPSQPFAVPELIPDAPRIVLVVRDRCAI